MPPPLLGGRPRPTQSSACAPPWHRRPGVWPPVTVTVPVTDRFTTEGMRNTTLSTQAREYKIQSASVGHTNDRSIARPTRRRRVVVRRPRRGLIHLRHGRNDGAYRNGSGGEHTGPRLENKSGSRRVWRHALRCHITFQCCNYPGRRLLQRCGSRKRVTGTMTPLSLRS